MTRKLRPALADAGRALADYLAERLAEPAAASASRVTAGSVFVDQRRVRDPRTPLVGGERIIVHESPARVESFQVVHLDEDLIAVDKPSGLPVQATRDGGGALDEQVAALHPGARLFHRIDRDTSGLVLFTRRPEAHRRFAAALAAGQIRRFYRAVVVGTPMITEIDAPIAPDPADRRRFAVHSSGRPARTMVRVVETGAGVSLVELELITGRTHQARVHLAHAGHAILGDPLYGDARSAPRLQLHASRLELPGLTLESPWDRAEK